MLCVSLLVLAGCGAYGSNLAPWIVELLGENDALLAPAAIGSCSALPEAEVNLIRNNLADAFASEVSWEGAEEGALRACPFSIAPQQCESCVSQLAGEIYAP